MTGQVKFTRGDTKPALPVERVEGGRFAKGHKPLVGKGSGQIRGPYRKTRKLGPRSHPKRFVLIDKRTKEAAILKEIQDQLIEHCGGEASISFVEKELITRASWLALKIRLFDAQIGRGEELSEIATNSYLSWTGHLSRILRMLGVKAHKPVHRKSLDDYLMAADAAE